MKRADINMGVGLLLLVSIAITGTLGYIQSQLDLRKFIPHQYAAYVTLSLAFVHVCLNFKKVWRYVAAKLRRKKAESSANVLKVARSSE